MFTYLISPTIRLFVEKLIQTKNKDSFKILHYCLLCWETTVSRFPTQMVNNAESLFISWRHDAYAGCTIEASPGVDWTLSVWKDKPSSDKEPDGLSAYLDRFPPKILFNSFRIYFHIIFQQAYLERFLWNFAGADVNNHEPASNQVVPCCRQATVHYLGQCWPGSMSPFGTNAICLL